MSGSVEAAPVSVTTELVALLVWAAPALATGAPLAFTVMSTVSGGLDRCAVEDVGHDQREVQHRRAGHDRGR